MQRNGLILIALALLAGCTNFEPREKVASYDPETEQLTLPYPCPDWSQSQTSNYLNAKHSNYGCAVNTNSALQVVDPADLHMGHGTLTPDTEVTTRAVQQYRAGDIPQPLSPLQSTAGGSQ
jgi:type IV pilus biogenesis protein CpaD/CtpE